MARKTQLDLIRDAIEIQGYLPVPGPRGLTYHIRGITGTAGNGAWITDHPTEDMCGFVRIKPSAKKMLAGIARGIIARRDEIVAERDRSVRSAMGRL